MHRRGYRLACGTIALLASIVLRLPAQDPQDLFADVFGTENEEELPLPLYYGDRFLTDVTATVAPQRVLVDGTGISDAVAPLLNDDGRARLSDLVTAGEMVDIGEFSGIGLFLTYQPEQARLQVRPTPDLLRERTLGPTGASELVNVQEPAQTSGFLNLRGRSGVATGEEIEWLQAEFEPVANYRGWVLESLIGVTTVGDEPVSLRHSRLVRDLPVQQIRLEAGIVRYETGALFGLPDVIGASATREETIGFGPSLFNSGAVRFVVPAEGPVDIYVNNRLYQSYRLSPGPHTATGMPFGQGTNDLRIIGPGSDESPERPTIREERIYYSPRLVVPGRHVYSGAAGIVRDVEIPRGVFASALYRYGVTDRITLGGGTQLSPSEYALGGQGLFATAAGITRADLAGYASDRGETGVAVEIGHAFSLLSAPALPQLEVQGRYETAEYHRVLGLRSFGETVRTAATATQRVGARGGVSATLLRIWSLDGEGMDETALRLAGRYRSREGYSLNAQIGPTWRDGEITWQGGIFLRISSDDQKINTSANYDIGATQGTLQVGNAPRDPYRSLSWNATAFGFDQSPGSVEYGEATVGYTGYRGSVSATPRVQRTVGAESNRAGITTRYASALVWAGGPVFVSRPVQNGFVVFEPRPNVADFPIPVRPSGGAVTAVVRDRGAVLPDLPSWGTATVTLDGTQLPDGYFPGTTPLTFRTGYRTGYRVTVGSAATVYVTGRLVDDSGEPIALEAGEIVDAFGNAGQFFSNRDGAFEIIDVAPGEYRLYLYRYPDAQSLFAVPDGETGRFDLEDVVFLTEES
jgi:outer membrane usher protein FimD/PapC